MPGGFYQVSIPPKFWTSDRIHPPFGLILENNSSQIDVDSKLMLQGQSEECTNFF
jgi:hypothetical protein